ncbi:MAG: DNA-directed RNA polymerase subunit H [Candidatus Micrarchaeota archaeon]|nr:DNA-directed RNA polymerase subunit H [Candidatus Micrarchaeota archaeon]
MPTGRKKSVQKQSKKDSKDQEIDISVNFLVPYQRVMTDNEVEELLDKYKIEKSSLPYIYIGDPSISKLNAKEGDVIEITRKDYVGEYKYYRVVVGKILENVE